MATIQFFEKPGCKTNTSQKHALAAAGHEVHAKSLLTEPWTAECLRSFFGDTPVANWFNAAAPALKSGAVIPQSLEAADALALMLADPLLIKRPLLQIGEQKCAGFNPTDLAARLGLHLPATPQGCSSAKPCPTPEEPQP
jgi:nitrogenase-associated protein